MSAQLEEARVYRSSLSARSWLRAAARLAVASLFTPLHIWVTNAAEVGPSTDLLWWGAGLSAAALTLWRGIVAIGGDPDSVADSLFWSVALLGFGSTLADDIGVNPSAIVVLAGLLAVVVYRAHRLAIVSALTTWALYTAIAIPAVLLLTLLRQTEQTLSEPDPLGSISFRESPDVVLVIFDGHASHGVVTGLYDNPTGELVVELENAGLTVVDRVAANYPVTHLSLASAFDMDYPMSNGDIVTDEDWDRLLAKVRGENRLVEAFRTAGYHYTLVESGWSAIRCSQVTDGCVRGLWPDAATTLAIEEHLLGSVFNYGPDQRMALGALHSFGWLRTELPGLLSNDTPDLILVHVMAPHPPLFLRADCSYQPREDMGGTIMAVSGADEETLEARKRAYVGQVLCVHSVMLEVSGITRDKALLVMFSDHGPDSLGQWFRSPHQWTVQDVEERFPILFATNQYQCDLRGLTSLVNLGRLLVNCLSDDELGTLEDRFFVAVGSSDPDMRYANPIIELSGHP